MARRVNSVLLFFLCWLIPTIIIFHLPIPDDVTPLQLNLLSFFFVGGYLVLASSLARRVMVEVLAGGRREILLCLFFSLGLFILLYILGRSFEYFPIAVIGISTANLLLFASIIGAALSSAVTRVAELVPICLTAAIADLVSVLYGPTREMIENLSSYYAEGMKGVPPFVDFIIIKAGVPGFEVPVPLFGMTDWIFLILISSAMLRLQKVDNLFANRQAFGIVLYFPVSAAALFAGLVFAQIANRFVPAMVFISSVVLVFLLVKMKIYREMRKSDIIYSVVFPAAVVVLILLLRV